jgi:hypothetical protein
MFLGEPPFEYCRLASHFVALRRITLRRITLRRITSSHRLASHCIAASHHRVASPPRIASPHCIASLRVPSPRPHFVMLARTRESIKVDGTCFLVNLHLSIATSHRILLHHVVSPCVASRRRIALHCIASHRVTSPRHIAASHRRVASQPRIASPHCIASLRVPAPRPHFVILGHVKVSR